MTKTNTKNVSDNGTTTDSKAAIATMLMLSRKAMMTARMIERTKDQF